MEYSSSDYNILSYLLFKNQMSFNEAIDWAYRQFKADGVDPFIEKISLASDKPEIIELINNEYQVSGIPSPEYLLGEVADKYLSNQITLLEAIQAVLFDLDVDLTEKERSNLYIAEDYFGWDNDAEANALLLALPIFKKYLPDYKSAIFKFNL
jgi:hypothetical protein